ncbi:MAG: pyrroline-5-carboxylate reductase [Ruminococcus sp.]|jgi:pyrroline-5-carboxylate reductase|nr:pyrroline-5-carboxylate reductase [Ruminococcus sp.]
MINVGFLGCGNMGGAIIKSSFGKIPGAQFLAFDMDEEKLKPFEEMGVINAGSESKLTAASKYLFLALKPQQFGGALRIIAPAVNEDTVLISIAAGISGDFIRERIDKPVKIIRAMPNTPALVGLGAVALAKLDGVTDEEFAFVKSIFDCCGITEEIPESQMNEIICINASSPAFIYLFAKGFIDYADEVGISHAAAQNLFSQALVGSAKMITQSGVSIDELIKMVTSPGGTTLAGLTELNDNAFLDIIKKCCEKCTARAYELGK